MKGQQRRKRGRGGRGEKAFAPSAILCFLCHKGGPTSIRLHKTTNPLISLIIFLIISVDNSVDKLWISCGWSCG
jgi:hypothetical protein